MCRRLLLLLFLFLFGELQLLLFLLFAGLEHIVDCGQVLLVRVSHNLIEARFYNLAIAVAEHKWSLMPLAILAEIAILPRLRLNGHAGEERLVQAGHNRTHRLVYEVFPPVKEDVG